MALRTHVSAQDVAEKAGVSRSAVSRTFTPGASVSAQTRRRVLQAADELGYHVNHLARSLTRSESGIVCLIVADMGTPYRSNLTRALTEELQNAGKVAMLVNTDRSDGSVDVALRQAIRYRADASIILSGMPDRSISELCVRNGQRLVLINRDEKQDGSFRINLDDEAAAEKVVTAFARAGCRRVAVANSAVGTPSLMARERGFATAASAVGLPVTIARHGMTGYECGRVLAQRLLTLRERPDGVFCTTDLIACGFLDAARHDFGVSVPAELCVAGFDDIEQASWTSYDLTTFEQPVESIARAAVSWLARTDEATDSRPAFLKLHAEMIWRSTIRSG